MARFLADENFPLPTTEALRDLGHEVTTAHEAGLADRSAPDEEVLEFAAGRELALLTMNRRHFIRLHAQRPDHFGIVVCGFDPDFVRQAQQIHMAVEAEATLEQKLLRVHRPSR
jgi:hypothetical protein